MYTFFMNVCKEKEVKIAQRLIDQITSFYPGSQVLVISENKDLGSFNWEKTTYIQSEPLKTQGNIGRFLERNYKIAIGEGVFPKIVKLDPDTYIEKNINLDKYSLAGHVKEDVNCFGRFPIICGGFIVYDKTVLKLVLESDLLRDPIYYATTKENPTIDHIYKRLDLKVQSILEVNALYRGQIGDWAIIHPVKELV